MTRARATITALLAATAVIAGLILAAPAQAYTWWYSTKAICQPAGDLDSYTVQTVWKLSNDRTAAHVYRAYWWLNSSPDPSPEPVRYLIVQQLSDGNPNDQYDGFINPPTYNGSLVQTSVMNELPPSRTLTAHVVLWGTNGGLCGAFTTGP